MRITEQIEYPITNDDNITIFTVSELSGVVKQCIENNFQHIHVRAEVGRVSSPASGHIYLDLKDDKSVLSAIIWKGTAQKIPIQPEQGLAVICTGYMTIYPGQSRYQLIIEHIEPAGIGALMALFETRKKKLSAEGLFLEKNKKPLPYLPKVIGIITSVSGAVIRDILHRLSERFPCHVLVWSVCVQGKTCADEVTQAITGFNNLGDDIPHPDLLIVARGGGSLEDLWGFNEENVVRAVAQSNIPVISAIGHETDITLIDYVADLRASTPTAAAEKAVPVRAELQDRVIDVSTRILRNQIRILHQKRDLFVHFTHRLPNLRYILALPCQRLDHVMGRLERGLSSIIHGYRDYFERFVSRLSWRIIQQYIRRSILRLDGLDKNMRHLQKDLILRMYEKKEALRHQLDLLSHESILARGFALVLTSHGVPLRKIEQVAKGELLDIQLTKGQSVKARVEKHQKKSMHRDNRLFVQGKLF